MFTTPHLDSTLKLTPNQKSYQLSKQEKEFHVIEEMYSAPLMQKRQHIKTKTTKHPSCIMNSALCTIYKNKFNTPPQRNIVKLHSCKVAKFCRGGGVDNFFMHDA